MKPKKRKLATYQRRVVKEYTNPKSPKGKLVDAACYAEGLGKAYAELLRRAGEVRTSLR